MSTAVPATAASTSFTSQRALAALEACPDGVVVVSDLDQIVAVNRAAEVMLGRSRDRLVGARIADFVDPSSPVPRAATELLAVSGDGPMTEPLGVLPFERDDGSLLHLDVTVVRTDMEGAREFTVFLGDVTALESERARHRAAADRYQAIVQHSQQALILCADPLEESVIISGESCLGYPAHTPLPRGVRALVHPDDATLADHFIESAQGGGPHDTSSRELRLRSADGRWLTCQVVAENLRHDPAVRGVVFRVLDVTQRRAQESQVESHISRLQLLIDNLDSAIMLEGQDRRVLVANEAFATMFSIAMSPRELVGADCRAAGQAAKSQFADPEGFLTGITQRMHDYVPVLGERLTLANGDVLERDYLPLTAPNGPAGHMWAYRNVTRLIRETQLLEEQNRSLEQLSQLKSEFVARVSHELRSPLTSVVSFADLLRDSTKDSLSAEEAEFLEIITRNAQRLLRLINDLLLVAKLESHTLPLRVEPVELSALVDQVVAELRPRAEEKSIDLIAQTGAGPRLLADTVRLQQVVTNLLGNAIRYTPDSGSIQVITSVNRARRRWELTVRDSGIGIPSEDLPRLFEPYFRSTHAREHPAGLGLGLTIVRFIVDEHGGDISVESTPGEGTAITVHLPLQET